MNFLSYFGVPKLRFGACLAVLSISVLLPPGTSQAGGARPFKATFHGFAEAPTPTDVAGVFQIIVPLEGQATHLGKFDEYLVHYFDFNTYTFTGYTVWTAANGDQFYTTFFGEASHPDNQGWLTFDVFHTIMGGTGRFEGASGGFVGSQGHFNAITGEDLGDYSGTISY